MQVHQSFCAQTSVTQHNLFHSPKTFLFPLTSEGTAQADVTLPFVSQDSSNITMEGKRNWWKRRNKGERMEVSVTLHRSLLQPFGRSHLMAPSSSLGEIGPEVFSVSPENQRLLY